VDVVVVIKAILEEPERLTKERDAYIIEGVPTRRGEPREIDFTSHTYISNHSPKSKASSLFAKLSSLSMKSVKMSSIPASFFAMLENE
jgi:hypothetical protein